MVMNEPIRFYDRALSRMTRRELLNVAWKLGLAAVLQPMASSRAFAQPIFRSYPFALGVASGEPSPDGVVLWTRLAPEPLAGGGMPMANVEVSWELAQDRAFTMPTAKGVAVARPELGHSVRVEPNGLAPGREYFYRFRVGREVSPIGRTKTAPAAGAEVDRLRFAVCGCSHYEAGYFTAYRRIAAEQFDFVFHTGDYIYEGRENGGQNPALVRQHQGDEIYTLVDYRNRYAQYKIGPRPAGGARFGALHRDVGRSRGRQRLCRRARRERHAAGGVSAAASCSLSGVFRNDAAARGDDSQRAEHAHLSPAPVRKIARSECARHAAVSFEAGLQRDDRDRVHGGTGSVANDPRIESGAVAVRPAGQGQRDLDCPRPAGADLCPRQPARRAERPLFDGQMGRLRRLAAAALRRDCARRRLPIRSCCRATCTSTTAPT